MNHPNFLIQAYSWTIISPNEFIKKIDKSTFHDYGSAIPMEIKEYFGIQELQKGEQKGIILIYQQQIFKARIILDIQPQPRARMFWKADFSKLLQEKLPGWYEHFKKEGTSAGIKPKIRFVQKDTSTYEISFITEKSSSDSVTKIEWDISSDKTELTGLTIRESELEEDQSNDLYIPTPPPAFGTKEATPPNFYSQHVNFAENQIKNKACGDAGELFVLEYEKQFLVENGRPDLTEQVRHIAYLEGDGAGYDIESRTIKGEVKYIEVKTTTGGEKTPFIITANELAFSQCYSEHYYLYRVYNFNIKDGKGLFYILQGDIAKNAPLEPIQYRTKV